MLPLITWALLVWGVTSVITQGRILRGFRELFAPETLPGDFVRCPQCIGWWVGLSLSLLPQHLGPAEMVLQAPGPPLLQALQLAVEDAFAACAVAAGCSKIEDALRGIASLMVTRPVDTAVRAGRGPDLGDEDEDVPPCPLCHSRDVIPDERGMGWYCQSSSEAHASDGFGGAAVVTKQGFWFTDGRPSKAS